MKKIWKKRLLTFVTAALTLSGTAYAAPAEQPQALTAEEIAPLMGAGWNLGNSLDAYHPEKQWAEETTWHNPRVTKELITAVHKAGFNTIRIPVTYIGRVGPAPDYRIDPAYLARVREVVDYAYDQGMFVIINIHHDGGGDWEHGAWLNCEAEDQEPIQAKFTAMWRQLAETFRDYDQHLLFEAMNEIHEHQNWGDPKNPDSMENLNCYNQLFLDTVRQTGGKNAQRILIVSGYNTNIYYTTTPSFGFVLPSDSVKSRMMLSVHFYDPYDFTLNDNAPNAVYAWGSEAEKSGERTVPGEDERAVDASMQALYQSFTSKGIPVVVGEFGTIDKAPKDASYEKYRRAWYRYVSKDIRAIGAVPIVWDNGYADREKDSFALFDRKTGEITQPELIQAIQDGYADGVREAQQANETAPEQR